MTDSADDLTVRALPPLEPEGAVEMDVPTGPMDRRGFVTKAAAGMAGTGLVAACGPTGDGTGELDGAPAVQTGRRVLWRLASSYPRNIDTIWGAGEVLVEELAALTNGRFQLRVYPAGELVPALQVMDAVQQNTVQCCHTASYYFTGKSPVLAFDACVPFGLTPRQQNAWLFQAGGLEQMQRAYSDFNIINFPSGNTGAQMGGWFRREVESRADLQGLKMRIPGLGGQVMDRMGVAVQNIAGGEVYPALERGAIDAAEWVGPHDDERLGLHQAASFYYYPGWWEPGPGMSCLVNLDAWNQLPSDYQAAFRIACKAAHTELQTAYDAKNPPALRRLIDGGVQMRKFSPEIMDFARTTSETIMEENASADATYREVYESWKRFKEESFQWFGTNELAYAEYAFRQG